MSRVRWMYHKILWIYFDWKRCCRSEICIPYPDIFNPNSGSTTTKRTEEKFFCITFICSHKFHKKSYFTVEQVQKKIWANWQRIKVLFTQKSVTELSEIWVEDPGYAKNLSRIPDPGIKKHRIPDLGSGSATLIERERRICVCVWLPCMKESPASCRWARAYSRKTWGRRAFRTPAWLPPPSKQ